MVIARRIRDFRDDEHGGALVEALLVMNVILLMLVAFIELTIAVNQWNAANKALQLGARIASVSDPAVPQLMDYEDPGEPGEAPGNFGTFSCVNSECETEVLERITGVVNGNCAPNPPTMRMCHMFPNIANHLDKLQLSYSFAELGYAGRPGGPVPLINLTMSGVPFDFLLLGAFIGQDTLTMPEFSVSAVAEDLSTTY